MKNRWFTSDNQRKALTYFCCALIGAGCVFATGAHAASLDSSLFGSGDILIGSTNLIWTASTNGINCPPPLASGAEQVSGSYSENFVSQGGTIEATTSLNNLEIIQQKTTRKFSMDEGFYREQSVYQGMGQSANPNIICGPYIAPPVDGNATETAASTTPESTAYCEYISSLSTFSGPMNYQSETAVKSLDITPDTFNIQAEASGNGFGTMEITGYSMAALPNTTTLGYTNSFRQSVSGAGKYEVGGKFQWTSFRNTFDLPETTG